MNEISKPVDETVLVVDLDGTLLRSDMLFESFCASLSQDWRTPFYATRALSNGRSALKRELAAQAAIDVATLPYNEEVIAYVQQWRDNGGRSALVTASDQTYAELIGAQLGIFDEVHGSDGKTNLKGTEKSKLLVQRFGAQGFDYIGDSKADLEVWQHARKAITINLSAPLRREVDKLSASVEHLTTASGAARDYVRALRPHQWLKNILVFVPMLAAHQINLETFFQSTMGFLAFCMIASAVYVLNDLLDLKADRAHPRKCRRPFAAGQIPIAHGLALFFGLILLGVLLTLPLNGGFALTMMGYFSLTTAYSLSLKRRVIIDIITLAGLYTLRLLAGAMATGIPLSIWLMAFSVFIFFSLASVKRQAELVSAAARGQLAPTGRGYHVEDLPVISMMAIGSGFVAVLVLMLYVNSPEVQKLYSSPVTLMGICAMMLYWISRLAMLTHRGHMHDDPVVFTAKDRISQVCILIMGVFAYLGVVL